MHAPACHRKSAPEGGPSSCCTLIWISVANVWITVCSMRSASASKSARRPLMRDGLRGFARRLRERYGPVPVCAAIESMNGARFVHDTLERCGWEVEVADATKVKGFAPLACKTDRIDSWVLAELSRRDLVPAIWLPSFEQRAERERARFRLFLVRKCSSLKHRIHAQLLAFGHACPVSDLFGRQGRELLDRLDFPEPWRSRLLASIADDRRLRLDRLPTSTTSSRRSAPITDTSRC